MQCLEINYLNHNNLNIKIANNYINLVFICAPF